MEAQSGPLFTAEKRDVIGALYSSDATERAQAACVCALRGYSEPEVSQRLIEMLRDSDSRVILSATNALPGIVTGIGLDEMLENTRHRNAHVRAATCVCISAICNRIVTRFEQVLTELASDPDHFVAYYSLAALESIGRATDEQRSRKMLLEKIPAMSKVLARLSESNEGAD